jgi:plasmid stabilization system protein ParE
MRHAAPDGTRPSRTDPRGPHFAFGRYVVFYEPLPDGIDVVRVLHGSRDIDHVFEE